LKKIFRFILLLSFILLIPAFYSCSTKKNKFFNRKYHGLTAHYNAYFNGNEGLKEGIIALSKAHTDDYTNILPVYRLGTPENAQSIFPMMDISIKKGSISIKKHSMMIGGKEYNKWIDRCYMIIGKAQYYKKDYELAMTTFEYMASIFPNPVKSEAILWIVKCLNEKRQFDKAGYYIDQIKENVKKKAINKETEKEFPMVLADFYIKQQNYEAAIKPLTDAIKINKSKSVRTRLTFILAQVYERTENLKKASVEYTNVIKQKPNYEMAFNARINLAKCYDAGSANSKLIKKELTKMTKDKKNKDYLDQIYYCFAEIALKEEDTLAAIKYLKLSTKTSLKNTKQKAMSYLLLGEIYYTQRDYEPSAMNYDSAMAFLPKDYPDFKTYENKRNTLDKLVKNINIVKTEDSLQMISRMSPAEQEIFVQKMIDEIIKQEQKKLQEEMERQQQLFLTNNNQGDGSSNNSSGGLWYFYNSSAVSFGYSEFAKEWGNRKLEDNWRLSNKLMTLDFNELNNINGGTDSSGAIKTVSKKDKKEYLKNIPNTQEQLDESNKKIFSALTAMGIIYKEELADAEYSIETFEDLAKRYTPEQFNMCYAYYQLFRLYSHASNIPKSDYYKNLIFAQYPESDYAKLLKNPDYNKNLAKTESEAEKYYKQTYELYLENKYTEVIANATKAKDLFGKNKMLPKFDYLKALAIAKTQPVDSFEVALNDIITKYPDSSEIRNITLLSLDYIRKNRKTDIKDTSKNIEPVITAGVYKSDPAALHFYVMVIDILSNININELKYKISDYNTKYYSLNYLSISNVYLDDKKQLITVSSFENKDKAMLYYNSIKENTEVFVKVNPSQVTQFVMTVDNYGALYKNKSADKYLEFFKEAYLK
jgi:tetratricopeptide (TPR) repeat protein